MKRSIAFALIFALCAAALCGCAMRAAKNEGYVLYRSSPVGVEIEYPDFWEMKEDKKTNSVAFAAPQEGFGDEYRDNVSVISYPLEKDEMAFDDYVSSYIDSLPGTVAGYKLVSEGAYPLPDYPDSYRVVYEGSGGEGELRLQQTFIKNGDRVFIFSFIAEPNSYEYFGKNADVMLSTFKALSDK